MNLLSALQFREPYRPSGPSVLAECTEKYFDLAGAVRQYAARYMLYVVPVRPAQKQRVVVTSA